METELFTQVVISVPQGRSVDVPLEEAPELGEVDLARPADVEVPEERLDVFFAQTEPLPTIEQHR